MDAIIADLFGVSLANLDVDMRQVTHYWYEALKDIES